MGVVTLIEKGSADQVKAKAVDALAFARKQHWPDQEVVVKMLVAGAMLKEKRFAESIGIYQSARTDAERAGTAGHPAGTQLVLQTWFGEAGSHLAAGDPARAADCYDHAAALAERIPNPILAIEAFRMSAFCHAQLDQREAAKARGIQALDIGENLRAEARGMTSLPLAAMALLGVIETERARQIEAIRHQLDRDGENARAALEKTAAGTQSAQALQVAERTLERDTAAALERAERELQALIGGGREAFRATFTRARAQLGVAWPLASPLAIMPATRTAAGATA